MKKTWKKLVAMTLTVAMVTGMLTTGVLAVEDDAGGGAGTAYCGQEEHTHGDGCYTSELTCTKEYEDTYTIDPDTNENVFDKHIHGDGCYASELTCEQEEHTHNGACMMKVTVTWDDIRFSVEVEGSGELSNQVAVNDGNSTLGSILIQANMTSVTVNGDITIPQGFFGGCDALETVELRNGVIVGDGAFSGCENLKTVTIENVAAIGTGAFYYLNRTNAWSGINEDIYCDSLTTVTVNGAGEVGAYAFAGCRNLTEATLVNVGKIGENIFYNCLEMEKLTLDGVNPDSMDPNSFFINGDMDPVTWGTANPIKELTLKNMRSTGAVYTILSGVADLTLEKVDEISKKAFQGLSGLNGMAALQNVTMSGVKTIGEQAFLNSPVTSVTLDGPVDIGKKAFEGCNQLPSITLQGGTIGNYAFKNCTALAEIPGLSTVSAIDARTFEGCTNEALKESFATISPDTKLGYSSTFMGVPELESRMREIMGGKFGLALVPRTEELKPDGWESSKTSKQNSTEPDNTQITKEAKWADENKTVADVQVKFNHSEKPSMDFLFILDLSNSMASIGGSTDNNSRFYDMQSKMLDVATKLVANKDYNNQVAFVTFGGYVSKSNPCHIASTGFTDDPEVVAQFTGMTALEQNTDYYTAFTEAEKLVNAHAAGDRKDRPLTVIFITDGMPNRHSKTQTTNKNTNTPNNNWNASLNNYISPIVSRFSEQGVKIFGVMQSVPGGEVSWAKTAMETICTDVFPANNTEEFSTKVNEAIAAAYSTYTIVDKVGKDFDLDVSSLEVSNAEYTSAVYDETTKTITWTIHGIPLETYTLSYKENLKQVNGAYPTGNFNTNNGNVTVAKGGETTSVNEVETPVLSRYTYTLTVHYVYNDGTTAHEDHVQTELFEGTSYSVTSPAISGYAADKTVVEGIMPAENVEVTVVYTKQVVPPTPSESPEPSDEPSEPDPTRRPDPTPTPTPAPVETPEPTPSVEPSPEPTETPEVEDLGETDVPLGELPEETPAQLPQEMEDLEDGDVPLAAVPETGDSFGLWLMMSVGALFGLAWLGKKKEEA